MGHIKDFDIRIRNGGDDAIAAVAELWETREKILFDITDAFTKARWIPVSERLPGKGLVLACTPDSGVIVIAGWFEKDCQWIVPEWFNGANHGKRKKECFSHWMPLPLPPSP